MTTPDRTAPLTAEHRFSLVVEDEIGDLFRCSCGAQDWDFAQGEEAYARHLATTLAREPSPDTAALDVYQVEVALTAEPLPFGTVLGGRSYADWRAWYEGVTERLNALLTLADRGRRDGCHCSETILATTGHDWRCPYAALAAAAPVAEGLDEAVRAAIIADQPVCAACQHSKVHHFGAMTGGKTPPPDEHRCWVTKCRCKGWKP